MTAVLIKISENADPAGLAPAAEALKNGKLVIIPTETVYGVACRTGDSAAAAALVSVKGRPQEKPFTVHLAGTDDMAGFSPRVSLAARRVMDAFMPGPLTVVLACGRTEEKIGFRVPEHPVAREFIRLCGGSVLATSANPSGAPSPKSAQEAIAGLGRDAVAYVIDSGPTGLGRDSTVADLSGDEIAILRQGALESETLAARWADAQ